MPEVTALIVDIVRSRELADRSAAQAAVRDSFAAADLSVPPRQGLWATVGDEFQAVYERLEDALTATTIARLSLRGSVDCRFGIGDGDARRIDETADGNGIQDGSAWWNARAAIVDAARLQAHGSPYLRGRYVGDDPERTALGNAYLTMRDHTISRMTRRDRRLAAAYLTGHPQADIARAEKMSQSAVSQRLQRCGATALAATVDILAADRAGHAG